MLITLQSNSDADASQFTNYFKQSVQIEPGSEIALVSLCYKFENSIVVNGTNNVFTVQLGTQLLTCTVIAGTYATSDLFLAALNTALTTAIDASKYHTQLAFPTTDNFFSWTDPEKTKLKLTLAYSPVDWDLDSLVKKTAAGVVRKQIDLDDAGMMSDDGDGIVVRVSTAADDWSVNTTIAGTDITRNCLWGTAFGLPAAGAYGNFQFRALGTTYDVFMGFSQSSAAIPTSALWEATTATNLCSGIRLISDGTFTVEEYDAATGFLEVITIAPIAYAAGDTFEIRVPQRNTDSPRYFQQAGAGAQVEITSFVAAADRFVPSFGQKMYPRCSLENQKLGESLVEPTLVDVIDLQTTVISIPGTAYKVNDVITITGNASGNVCKGYINAVDGNGGITNFFIEDHVATWLAGDNDCVVEGTVSGNDDCRIAVGLARSADVSSGGTGYTANPADIYADDNTTLLGAPGDITIDTVAGGAITGFTFNNLLPNSVVNYAGYVLHIHQAGSDDLATITINATNNYISRVGAIQYTTILDTDTQQPLRQHQNLEFTSTANFTAMTHLNTANSAGPVLEEIGAVGVNTENRQTDTMLVNVDQFQVQSICKSGGLQKAIGVVPYGTRTPGDAPSEYVDGTFYEEPFNMTYHALGNKQVENHNQLQVRLTDSLGEPLSQLIHPTTLTLDIRPKTM